MPGDIQGTNDGDTVTIKVPYTEARLVKQAVRVLAQALVDNDKFHVDPELSAEASQASLRLLQVYALLAEVGVR